MTNRGTSHRGVFGSLAGAAAATAEASAAPVAEAATEREFRAVPIGAADATDGIPAAHPTLPSLLKAAGYATEAFVRRRHDKPTGGNRPTSPRSSPR